jgi:TolB-like protein
MLALALAAAAAGVLAVWWGRGPTGAGAGGMALAVLPFVDHGGVPPHLADRLTDGLIGELTRTSGLAVRSRTSVMQFQGVRRPLSDVARELDAQVLMEGSVAMEGGRLVVDARLVDAAADRKLWAEQFEGTPDDVRGLQRRIAAAATAILRERGSR